MKITKTIASLLIPALLLSGCSDGSSAADIDPSEAVQAVLAETPISSGIERGKEDLDIFDDDIDASLVESASYSLCASGAYPDAVAVIKCTSAEAAGEVLTVLQAHLDEQKELYETYTPDEMYKLEGAKVYSKGNYAIYIAVSDNDKAQEIIDGRLAG